jgi:hypothetical protein
MATTIPYFMTPDDEKAFLRSVESLGFDVYPEASEHGYRPFRASGDNAELFTDEAYYFALPTAGELIAREIRRGPHKGMLELDEVRSPVIHYARSLMEDGELRSGRLWSELEATGDRQHLMTKPDLLRSVVDTIRTYFKKHYRHSKPAGYFIGPNAARKAAQEGLVLREAGRKGKVITPYK